MSLMLWQSIFFIIQHVAIYKTTVAVVTTEASTSVELTFEGWMSWLEVT